MKRIVFGSRTKRVIARLFDFTILGLCSFLIYYFAIFPNVFDSESFRNNQLSQIQVLSDSGLFIVDSNNNYAAISTFSTIDTVDEMTNAKVFFNGTVIENVNLTKQLVDFYTLKYEDFSDSSNLSFAAFKKDVLKIDTTDSNIKDLVLDEGVYKYTLIDENKTTATVNFVLDTFATAAKLVINHDSYSKFDDSNRTIISNALVWLLPITLGFGLILELLIPLFDPFNRTLGKMIFGFVVLSKNGYTLKKGWLIPRALCYIIIEVIFGIMTFGSTILISYMMLIFNKKHRVLHDYFGNSVVANKNDSLWFSSQEEEQYIMRKRGFEIEQTSKN
jgi:uncharacterized RDD family membrane protein YckC